MAAPFRVVLCGKTAQIATAVKAGLQPEFEVIHVILSTSAGVSDLPKILVGKTPSTADPGNIGTQNYAQAPQAIILGGGYDDEAVKTIRAACERANKGDRGIPWLRPDLSVPVPPLGPKYGAAMVSRVKTALKELEEEGRAQGDGVYFF
ncbi:uncharacterized protein RSE6_12771 [Rhynchosporium secalis]|uniref:Uncharacterized protein n=1 Tax=Rhynchosporium secalis TaxID=38038 RepID=A0A1E1MR84_RHYSE|nr:uncharacterized protein RSE6_12771 [Rhynchosporium secalis]